MRLQRETDLNDTEAKQDKTDGTDKTENEIGQIVDYGNRVAGGKAVTLMPQTRVAAAITAQ